MNPQQEDSVAMELIPQIPAKVHEGLFFLFFKKMIITVNVAVFTKS